MPKTPATAEDDTTSLAGWLYTDLLLALTVVFLATISFIPSQIKDYSSTNNQDVAQPPSNSQVKTDKTFVFSTLLTQKSSLNLQAQTNQFLRSLSPHGNFTVRAIQIEGGFNPKTQPEFEGTLTAMDFLKRLKAENVSLFGSSNTTLSANPTIHADQAFLQIFFHSLSD